MATVYVKNIVSFDAANSKIVTFGYAGTQCTRNRIMVYNSSTNAIVYDNTVYTYTLTHTIPANTLTNGVSYYCTITAYYTIDNTEYNVTSSASNIFKCLTTPTWGITGLSNGGVIGNSYYTFVPAYSQAENETVNEYYIAMYTTSGTLYWSSGALYDVTASTTVTGLPNSTVFYVRIYGTTTNGFVLDTRNASTGVDFSVTVDYTTPSIYSLAYLENDKWNGWVRASTNISSVEGTPTGTYSFIDNKYLDLTASDSNVLFNSGFEIGSDFTIEALVREIVVNSSRLIVSGDLLHTVVTFRQGTFASGTLFYAELKETFSNYVLQSNMIEVPESTDFIYLFLQRKGGLYDLTIVNKGAEE